MKFSHLFFVGTFLLAAGLSSCASNSLNTITSGDINPSVVITGPDRSDEFHIKMKRLPAHSESDSNQVVTSRLESQYIPEDASIRLRKKTDSE